MRQISLILLLTLLFFPVLAEAEGEESNTPLAQSEAAPVQGAQSDPTLNKTPTQAKGLESKIPLDIKTSNFIRHESRFNPDGFSTAGVGSGDSHGVRYRARLGLIIGPIDAGRDIDVSVQLVPQASGVWGVGGATTTDAALMLHEGFIQFGNDSFFVQSGRLELVYGDHLVIGNVDWHPTARSFDALRVRLLPGDSGAWVDTFFSVITPTPGVRFTRGDLYFGGVYAALGKLISKSLAFDVYALNQVRKADAAKSISRLARLTLGMRVKNRVKRLYYRFEAGVQTGKTAAATILAGQADLEVGASLVEDKLRLGVEGAFASGDNPSTALNEAYDQLYPTAHLWLGLTDIIGARTNIATAVVHLSGKPTKRVKLYLDTHLFVRPHSVPASAIPKGLAGAEIDSGIIYKIAKGLRARSGYGIFLPANNGYATRKPAHFLEVELRYDRNP